MAERAPWGASTHAHARLAQSEAFDPYAVPPVSGPVVKLEADIRGEYVQCITLSTKSAVFADHSVKESPRVCMTLVCESAKNTSSINSIQKLCKESGTAQDSAAMHAGAATAPRARQKRHFAEQKAAA